MKLNLIVAKVAVIIGFNSLLIDAIEAHPNPDPIDVINASFEDTTGQTPFNEFTFGVPQGWLLYDPHGLAGPNVYTGTLQPNGVDFFNTLAPDGDLVAILYNEGLFGAGEYGFEQTLAATWQPQTSYQLSVEVGNIASGFAQNGQFFNLDEFPGYRIELLAGESVVVEDSNSLIIDEGQFETSVLSFSTTSSEPFLGQNITIRLVNLNLIPNGYNEETSPDLEVDFDAVTFDATLIGDLNGDGALNLLDVGPFIEAVGNGTYSPVADINQDGSVDLLDVGPFIDLLSN